MGDPDEKSYGAKLREEAGQDLIEYGLLASSVSVVAIGAILSVGAGVKDLWDVVVGQDADR